MPMHNLKNEQTLSSSHFLLSLDNKEYWQVLCGPRLAETLYEQVVKYAQVHYPHITIQN